MIALTLLLVAAATHAQGAGGAAGPTGQQQQADCDKGSKPGAPYAVQALVTGTGIEVSSARRVIAGHQPSTRPGRAQGTLEARHARADRAPVLRHRRQPCANCALSLPAAGARMDSQAAQGENLRTPMHGAPRKAGLHQAWGL